MIKIEHIETYGWEAAVRGARNPLNSWAKSDSSWEWVEDESPINPNDPGMMYIVGVDDLKLMKSLVKAGPDHDKSFKVEVRLNSNVIGIGIGKNKKQAEQMAAKEALRLMGAEI